MDFIKLQTHFRFGICFGFFLLAAILRLVYPVSVTWVCMVGCSHRASCFVLVSCPWNCVVSVLIGVASLFAVAETKLCCLSILSDLEQGRYISSETDRFTVLFSYSDNDACNLSCVSQVVKPVQIKALILSSKYFMCLLFTYALKLSGPGSWQMCPVPAVCLVHLMYCTEIGAETHLDNCSRVFTNHYLHSVMLTVSASLHKQTVCWCFFCAFRLNISHVQLNVFDP